MNDTKLKLTDRDLEILRLLGQGCTSAEIAVRLSLSSETIKWYRKRLLTKLDADNTAEMMRIVSEKNLI
jgi:DNA-binding CsgD family transcriptional regulator